MKKVVILGPESTGKTKLAIKLAKFFNGNLVQEYSREYLNTLGRKYIEKDLIQIAQGQLNLEDLVEKKSRQADTPVIFYDTDITVIKIWSEYKFGKCDPWILDNYKSRKYDFYLLTFPDLEWGPDPLRENPVDREELFDIYLDDLRRRDLAYKVIRGRGDTRSGMAINAVMEILKS